MHIVSEGAKGLDECCFAWENAETVMHVLDRSGDFSGTSRLNPDSRILPQLFTILALIDLTLVLFRFRSSMLVKLPLRSFVACRIATMAQTIALNAKEHLLRRQKERQTLELILIVLELAIYSFQMLVASRLGVQ